MTVNFFGSVAELFGVLLDELLVLSWENAALPQGGWRGLQKKELASEGGEAVVERGNVAPLHDAGAHAMGQVQGIDEDEAPGLGVFLHAGVKPLDMGDDAFEMALIFGDSERAAVFGDGERAISVGLSEVNQGSDFPRRCRVDVKADECIDERRFTDARRAFD